MEVHQVKLLNGIFILVFLWIVVPFIVYQAVSFILPGEKIKRIKARIRKGFDDFTGYGQ